MIRSILFALLMVVPVSAWSVEADIPVSVEDLTELKVTVPEQQAPSTDFAGEAVTEGAAPKSEADILVNFDSKSAEKSSESPLKDLALACALLGGFGLLAYLGLGRYRTRNRKVSQFQMKVLAQHHLGPKKSLAVVRVAGESVLIGVTDHHISMIKSLSLLDDEIPEEAPANFGGVFAKTEKNAGEEEETAAAAPAKMSFRRKTAENGAEQEDFTISKIRDVVHRQVRNLKSLE